MPKYQYLTSSKVCDWSEHIFGASASPRSFPKKLTMSNSSTVHGGQHDTKYVTLELLMQRHSWLTKFGVLCLNQLVLIVDAASTLYCVRPKNTQTTVFHGNPKTSFGRREKRRETGGESRACLRFVCW